MLPLRLEKARAERDIRCDHGDIEKGLVYYSREQHHHNDVKTDLGADWMSLIEDSTPMPMLTIPGTHDSAAFTNSWPFVATQTMDIMDQLNAGIRYFDLRCGVRKDVVEMVHGPTLLGITLEDVLTHMYLWLSAHSSEALIVQIKRDRKEDHSKVIFAQAVSKLLSQKSKRWRTSNTTPTLGELRGRIQLFRRFEGPNLVAYGLNVTRWQDNPTKPFTIRMKHGAEITIQDHYKFPGPNSLPSLITKKGGNIRELLDRAASDGNEHRWYLNFTSAYELNVYFQLTPREIAVGGWHLFRWEEGINVRLRATLAEAEGKKRRFGIVAMDFPEMATDDLIATLILSNFGDEAESITQLREMPTRLLFHFIVILYLTGMCVWAAYFVHRSSDIDWKQAGVMSAVLSIFGRILIREPC